jgi:hypothetical protein
MPPRHLPKSESSSAKPGTLQRKKEMLRKRGNPKMKARDESYAGNDTFYDFDSIMELIEETFALAFVVLNAAASLPVAS